MTAATLAFAAPADVVVSGVITGLTYGLLGVGLALVYRTSRVLNFAHGEIGALPATILPILVINHGWGYWPALVLALLLGATLGGLTERLVLRRLVGAPRLIALVATIGVSQLLLVGNLLLPRTGRLAGATYPTPFTTTVTVGGYVISAGQLMILVIAPLAVGGLTFFLRRSRFGIASRAAADNPEAAALTGIPVARTTLVVWVLAGLLATASAVLSGPSRPLLTQVALGPSLMVRALGAAMLGGLVSLPAVFAGGVAIGLLESLVAFNRPTGGTLELALFAVIAIGLSMRRGLGQSIRGGEERAVGLTAVVAPLARAVAAHPRVRRVRSALVATTAAVAVLAPIPMSAGQRVLATSVVLFALMGLSLVVLTGYAGQVSLGQFAFVGLGAAVGGRLLQLGYPPWTAALYATAAGAVVALLIGIPALRLRGLFLAVITLAFAVAANAWLFGQTWLVTTLGTSTSLQIPRPVLFGVDLQQTRNYYWLCLAVFVVVAAGVAHLRRTGVGRAMVAVRDNEASAAALSISPRRAKLTAFTLAGAIAGLAGYLYGGLLVTFSAANFGVAGSLDLLAMVLFGGVSSVGGAVLGALWVRGIPYFLGANAGLAGSGIGLLVVLLVAPGGLASVLASARDRVAARLAGTVDADAGASGDDEADVDAPALPPTLQLTTAAPSPADRSRTDAPEAPPPLLATDVTVSFGGVRALAGVSLRVEAGEIVGLVGPNGAGKTTLFDVLSGQLRPDGGVVVLAGTDVSRARPEVRAQLGLGRTFQQARLFEGLTVRDTLRLAGERAAPSELVPSLLGLPPSRRAERAKDLDVADLAELLGLADRLDVPVAELSTGVRRLVELGCVLGTGASIVLLDEPMAGVAQREVEAFVPVLQAVRRHLDAAMVVIDHDMPMMARLADRVVVLADGRVLADGSPSLLRDDPAVVAAYLGTDERAIARSGAATRTEVPA